ncbi:MAG TPA: glycosyltransferase family 39 protein [Gaiellaceae bacterium]|nr:glycosyltransferase family 39 protein [Gaiellaceae bacterium]
MSSLAVQAVRGRPLTLVRAVPAWAWLAGIVAVSALVRYAFGRRIVAPWIMVDELVYAELARSLAETGELRIRDEPFSGAFGVVYPLLLAPAYLLHESVPAAYALAKAINGFLFSLAAVPTYLLARRLVRPGAALAAALLAVAVPGALYSGMLMTENAFYPLVATGALALVLALERPTALRVAALLGVVGVAFLTRAQALVFLPALLAAPLLLVAAERSGLRGLARFRWLYALPAAGVAVLLAAQVARGGGPLDLLGAYRPVAGAPYELKEVARWTLYHVAELDLALGVAPFAALLLLASLAPALPPRERAFLAATVALAACMVVQVAAFASRFSLRVEERNLFHLFPLFVVALVVFVERGLPRPRLRTAVAAGSAAALPLLLPFERLVNVSATSDTFGLLLWWDVSGLGVPLERLWLPAAGVAAAFALLLALLPRRLGALLPALVAVFFLVSAYSVEHRIRTASIGHLFQGITHAERDWVDRAVGADAEVAALWTSRRDWLTVLQNEFFSRSVGPVYSLDDPLPTGLPQTPLETDLETGLLRGPAGREVRAEYALVDQHVPLAGTVVARDVTKEIVLLRTGGPLRLEHTTAGIHGDRWSGPTFSYRRYECGGGTLVVRLERDRRLIPSAQRVVARQRGAPPAAATVGRAEERPTLRVPLRPHRDGTCDVTFTVAPTAVPAGVLPGSDDTRRLGIRVLGFEHLAP